MNINQKSEEISVEAHENDNAPEKINSTANQETMAPKKVINSKVSILIVALCVTFIGFLGYFLYKEFILQPQKSAAPPLSVGINSQNNESVPTGLVANSTSEPDPNTLYIGTFGGNEVLIKQPCSIPTDQLIGYNNEESISHITNPSEAKYIVFVATISPEPSLNSTKPADFRRIKNPKKIFSDTNCNFDIAGIENVGLYNQDKSKIYVSLVFQSQDLTVNKLYQIDLSDGTSKKLWSHEIGNPNLKEYDGHYGYALIDQVIQDKYMVFAIRDCTGCSPYSPDGAVVVLNLDSLKELYLGLVGNVLIDSNTSSVSYQNKVPQKRSCADCTGFCPNCVQEADGSLKETVLVPSGTPITRPLP